MVAKSIAKMYTNIHKPTDYLQQFVQERSTLLQLQHAPPQASRLWYNCSSLHQGVFETQMELFTQARA